MFNKIKNFFKRTKTPKTVVTDIQKGKEVTSTKNDTGRSPRPIYSPSSTSQVTHNTVDNSSDFLSGYVAGSILTDLLNSHDAKVSETVEKSSPTDTSSWSSDYSSSKSSSDDSWSSSSSSDSWSSSSSSDSWSSSDSSSSSDW